MGFDWFDYLTLAEELSRSPSSAKLRTAISRAYYAVHHAARLYLRNKNNDRNIRPDGSAHGYVIAQFEEHSDEDHQKVGANLDRLRVLRTKADYRDRYGRLDAEARAAIKIAQATMALIKTLI